MAAEDIASRVGATYLGIESTFGTTSGTMVRCFPDELPALTFAQANLANDDERERLFKALSPVQGLKSGAATLKVKQRCDATRLDSTATPSATPWAYIPWKAGLGGEQYAAGTTCSASADANTITVASASGLKVGGWIGVEVSGSALEYTRITNISSTTISVWKLTGSPNTSSGKVINAYNYFPTQTNTQSLTLQHVKAQSTTNQRFTLLGGYGGCKLTTQRGAYLSAEWSLKFADWSVPTSDSVSAASASDGMGAPLVMRNALCYLQAAGTNAVFAHVPFETLDLELASDLGLAYTTELGGVQGNVGVMRTGARPFAKAKLTLRPDTTFRTKYDAGTLVQLVVIVPYGSGLTKSAVVIDLPTCVIADAPQYKDSSGQWRQDVMLEAHEDSTTTSSGLTGTNLDQCLAPFRVAFL